MAKRHKPSLPRHDEEERLKRGERFEELCDRLEDAIAKIRKRPQTKKKLKRS
jgi:hypothetical protein